MKRYSDTPINVRLGQYQENKLNEMIKNETYCHQSLLSRFCVRRKGVTALVSTELRVHSSSDANHHRNSTLHQPSNILLSMNIESDQD